jgi:hypothetical protein
VSSIVNIETESMQRTKNQEVIEENNLFLELENQA